MKLGSTNWSFRVENIKFAEKNSWFEVSIPQQLFELVPGGWVYVPSEKWVFQLGWVLKKFQVGRYKFQVGMGRKTWKCVLLRLETGTKPIKIGHVLGWKS